MRFIFACLLVIAVTTTCMGVACADSPAGMRLYVFSSGALTLPKGALQNFGPMDSITVPVAFFVIQHPKGNVLFDTGNNDKIIEDPDYWGPSFKAYQPVNTPDVAIDTQLKTIGLTPDDIKYVVVSHLHLDHGGNVWKFPNSTLITQRDEIEFAMFPDEPFASSFIPGDIFPLRSGLGSIKPNAMPMLRLEGDMDIFGDGSIVVKRFRGHTKGSQMLLLRLPKSGTTILTGDSIYFRENLEKNVPPSIMLAYDPPGIMRGYEWVRYMIASEDATYFTSHDPDAFKAMKHAPEYYE